MECRKINGAVFPFVGLLDKDARNVTLRHTQRYRLQAALQKIQKDDISAAQVDNPILLGRIPQGRQAQSLLPGI